MGSYLYGGLPVKLAFYVPYQATYMYGYTTARMWLHTDEQRLKDHRESMEGSGARGTHGYVWRTMLAAVIAELSGCVIRVPMETLKMRIQSTVASGTRDAVAQLRRNGFVACARLVAPQTLLHDIPYSITQWVVYESLRPWRKRWGAREEGASAAAVSHEAEQLLASPSSSSSSFHSFFAQYSAEMARTFWSGGLSGLIAATVTVPLDNIRTRVVVATAKDPSLTIRQVIVRAYRADGVLGFLRGGGMRVLWVSSNMACYFPLFELSRYIFVQYSNARD